MRLPADEPTLVFDEVHKYARWRNLIKGIYDTNKSKLTLLVTGSARLDYYRTGGESLRMIFADGAWDGVKGGPTFFPLNGFTTEAMFDVLAGIHGRLDNLFRRRGNVQEVFRCFCAKIKSKNSEFTVHQIARKPRCMLH